MDIQKFTEAIVSPKVQCGFTAFFCWIGLYTKEELLTDLSILAVIIQLVISMPKLCEVIQRIIAKLKAKF